MLEGLKAALRLRRENGVSVCCFKMEKAVGRALSERLELSCEAPDIKSGAHDLALMPEMPESAKNNAFKRRASARLLLCIHPHPRGF